MIPRIRDYRKFVGQEKIEEVKELAEGLKGKRIININSSYSGGGVAEILNSLVILMNQMGMEVGWRLLKGSHSFFIVTKKFHNALQGKSFKLSARKKELYLEEIERNSLMSHFHDEDIIIVHDSQPLALINYMTKKQPRLWRCHVDLTNPDLLTWNFLKNFIQKYDAVVTSMEKYQRTDLKIPQHIIMPSIDPLTPKNKKLSERKARRILSKVGIDVDEKPLLTQVSRFDQWKNPLGVIKIFELVRKKIDCQLVLIGDVAGDDPEFYRIYEKVLKKSEKNPDIKNITQKGDVLVNALQSNSAIILQNSTREGFGLTVTEALWKKTPVIARNVGGIPLQVQHEKTGILVNSNREAAKWCLKLLRNEELRKKLGEGGREHVRKNFLITRQLEDYLNLFHQYLG